MRLSLPALALAACLAFTAASTQSLAQRAGKPAVSSPDKKLEVFLHPGQPLTLELRDGGKTIANMDIGLAQQPATGASAKPGKPKLLAMGGENKRYTDSLARIPALTSNYAEALYQVEPHLNLRIRLYNEGLAYRFVRTGADTGRTVVSELLRIHLDTAARLTVAYQAEKKGKNQQYYHSFENIYDTLKLGKADTAQRMLTPALAQVGGSRLLFTDAVVRGYPGIYLKAGRHNGQPVLQADFSPQVAGWRGPSTDPKQAYALTEPTGFEPFLSNLAPAALPWRVLGVCDSDSALLAWQLPRMLAPAPVNDFSWVRPGKVAWDWWNNWGLQGVPFVAGKNTVTYKAYIDFAAANKLQHVILDEGWATSLATMMTCIPEVDLPALVAYARARGVGVILWCTGYAMQKEMTQAFPFYANMGIAGFKADFLDGDDARMHAFMEDAVRQAAAHKLMIDWHGCSKQTGLERTWPNEINREGVFGLENYKWSDKSNPRQHLLAQTIRQAAGPMDFTPGAVTTVAERDFKPMFHHPVAKGTRCHTLTMYVCQHSPIMMLADSPTDYAREPDMMAFLSAVPTVWDEVRILSAQTGAHMAWAKRKGKRWFIGVQAAGPARQVPLNLSFLPGKAQLQTWADGPNAANRPTDYVRKTMALPPSKTITVDVAEGGGWVAIVDI